MDGIQIVPARKGRITPGYYLARRKSWLRTRPWAIVSVTALQDGKEETVVVWQFQGEPEATRHWRFRSKIIGCEKIPSNAPAFPRVEEAVVLHCLSPMSERRLAF
jgi:hypothetical protein